MEIHSYSLNLTWESAKKGVLSSNEFNPEIEVVTPPPFNGGIPGYWSPEHLFVASVSSCLMTTFLAIAENSKFEFAGFSCSATGKLEQIEGKYLITEIILKPELKIKDESQKEKAERILIKAEKACLISNSIHSKVTMIPQVIVESVGVF
ncbi:MAG: OsmC family protein [Saprospiraceae bacterium]|nr:OsmC family protein [Candidatus Vicinibacter proximus]MBL7822553.1 OsmC family protein [Saprospiraceae bacterium]MCC6844368.1 OsmC family protein [Saprospiraceae bacterium]HRG33650.1 OsmC family protein [Saprospiraceae bacterium]